jgi:hypothetical protein
VSERLRSTGTRDRAEDTARITLDAYVGRFGEVRATASER